MLQSLTAEGVENLRVAVELGKWPDGRVLDSEQKALCMQALIAWEEKYLPASERSGYLPGKDCSSKSDQTSSANDDIQIIRNL
ncbi:MAG: YeaC family protein [Pseudomonadales bacterium]